MTAAREAVLHAIRRRDVATVAALLHENPDLASSYVDVESGDGPSRSLLHVVADWPGKLSCGAELVRVLVVAGADVNARYRGSHAETPLHWAASSDDVEVIDALVHAGADLEAAGAVIAGGTPLDDAVAFGQWRAAHRLVELGAATAVWHAAALGLMDRLIAHFGGDPLPSRHPWGASAEPPAREIDVALWCACHGGQRLAAEYLLGRGADPSRRAPWDGHTPIEAARRSAATGLAAWLDGVGARPGPPNRERSQGS